MAFCAIVSIKKAAGKWLHAAKLLKLSYSLFQVI